MMTNYEKFFEEQMQNLPSHLFCKINFIFNTCPFEFKN